MRRIAFILAAGLCIMFPLTAQAGQLIRDGNGIRYREDDGSLKIGWHKEENGDWYFFDTETGEAKTGLFSLDGKTYYFQENDGVLQTNCKRDIEGTVWQLDGNGSGKPLGSSYQGWLNDAAGWKYRFSDGKLVTNAWYQDKGLWYFFDENGYMVTGLRDIGGFLYYFDTDGHMLSGTTVTLPDGRTLTLTANGNVEWPYKPITVIPPEDQKSEEFHLLDSMCDQILGGITSPEMTKRQKAVQVYYWIKGHMQYLNKQSGTDWVHEAVIGIRSGRGDCFTYYAMAQALLSRCGINCIQVIRSTDNNHYWVLANVEEGWFHFDCTPRRGVNTPVCLLTDAQMASLPRAADWIFDHSLYPRTP